MVLKSYRIPNEATTRTQRSKCRSAGISSIDHALYADDMYSIFRTKSALLKGMNKLKRYSHAMN